MDQPPKDSKRPLPPAAQRWKKGASGNPRGRPKKQDSLTSLLKEEIEKICPADKENRTWKDLVVRATLQLAMKGNQAAIHEIWNRMDGKLKQSLEHGGDGNGLIEFHVVWDRNEDSERDEE